MLLIFFSSVYKHIGLSQSHYLNNSKKRRDRQKNYGEIYCKSYEGTSGDGRNYNGPKFRVR